MSGFLYLLSFLLLAAADPIEVRTLDGRTLGGELAELTTQRLTLADGPRRTTLETDQILSIAAKGAVVASQPAEVTVELTDGSVIAARQYVARDNKAVITLLDGVQLDAPLNAIQSVRLARSPALDDEWARLTAAAADADVLVIRNGDSLDLHKGVVHEVAEDKVGFELDGEVLPVKRAKVYGFVYRHGAAEAPPPPVCRLFELSGSQWSVSTLLLSGKLRLTTPSGVEVSLPLADLARIDFSGGKIIYLSDLKPEAFEWTPYFSSQRTPDSLKRFYAPRFDRGFDSPTMTLGGAQYEKGLALHCRTEIVYRLPAGFRRFQATAGIDDAMRPAGNARLIIRGDDRQLEEIKLSGGEQPRNVDIDVSNVRRLTVLVDFSDNLGSGDRLLLCNARIVK
jgi:hypothetical protein